MVEANFSIDNATKQKNKKTDKQNSSLSKIGNFFKSTAGIATIIGVAFVVIAGVVIFSMLDVAKRAVFQQMVLLKTQSILMHHQIQKVLTNLPPKNFVLQNLKKMKKTMSIKSIKAVHYT